MKILAFQTAFPGDVILATPMMQALKRHSPDALIDVVAIPSAASLLENHPSINRVIVYDKRGADAGVGGALRLIRELRSATYDVAIIPHRSIRSGVICFLACIPRRIGFSTSAARFLMTDVVEYKSGDHEVTRNLSLLTPLEITNEQRELPNLFPSFADKQKVDELLRSSASINADRLVAIAPGSVWATKRWLPERYAELATMLIEEKFSVVLVGGKDDSTLCSEIASKVGQPNLLDTTGQLSFLESAELIRRCKVLITNDSAPLHIGVAMRTPVVAIFGATVPEFGFAPIGEHDEVVQTFGLKCRPCAIHGGNKCPITTFDCMKNIQSNDVLERVHKILSRVGVTSLER